MNETMTLPAPGPKKSCYQPSERFQHPPRVMTTQMKSINKNAKKPYIPLCHP